MRSVMMTPSFPGAGTFLVSMNMESLWLAVTQNVFPPGITTLDEGSTLVYVPVSDVLYDTVLGFWHPGEVGIV